MLLLLLVCQNDGGCFKYESASWVRCGVATVDKESNVVLLAEQWGRRQAAMVMMKKRTGRGGREDQVGVAEVSWPSVWQVMMIPDPELDAAGYWLQAPIRVFQEDGERRQLPAYQPLLYGSGR